MSDDRFLVARDGVWFYRRRVPIEYAELDRRENVRISTKIKVRDDPRGARAAAVAADLNTQTETYWRGLVEGQAAEAERRFLEARRRARALGLEYMPVNELVDSPLAAIAERLDKLVETGALIDSPAAKITRTAVLGGEDRPQIMLSQLFEKFEAQVAAELTDLSPDQRRKWKNPKVRAAKNLMTVIGDKPIVQITPNDALDFSEWWQARVIEEDLHPDTANKDMGHLSRMLFTLNKRYRLGLGQPFAGMRLEGGVENSRPPYDPKYVQSRLLAPGALASLNDEARRVLFLVADAGLRPTEAVNLNRNTIILDADIPHVKVLPDGRRMKTPQSRRDVPLVGVALEAARAQPHGFPRYHDSSAELSATVNKFLKENNLRQPEGDRTLYSLRHSFQDRLVAVKAEDSMIDALMGHKETGSKYGAGPNLDLKLEYLQLIAFKPPPVV